MKLKHLALISASGLFATTSDAQNLLSNPSFEIPVVAGDGNHIGITPTSWSVNTGNANAFNLVRSEGISTPAKDGAQYWISPMPACLSPAIHPRHGECVQFGGCSARGMARSTLAGMCRLELVEYRGALRGTQGGESDRGVRVVSLQRHYAVLAAGTYTFRATLDDTANVDTTFVTPVRNRPGWPRHPRGVGLFGIRRRRR